MKNDIKVRVVKGDIHDSREKLNYIISRNNNHKTNIVIAKQYLKLEFVKILTSKIPSQNLDILTSIDNIIESLHIEQIDFSIIDNKKTLEYLLSTSLNMILLVLNIAIDSYNVEEYRSYVNEMVETLFCSF